MRRPLAILTVVVPLAVLAAACGSDEPTRATDTTEVAPPDDLATTDIDDIEVVGEPGDEPALEFEQAFGVEETATRVVTEGDGEAVAPGTNVTFHFLFVNGRNGATVESSYGAEPASLVFEEGLLPGIYDGLNGAAVGSRILVAIAPADGLGADPTADILESDTLLFFAEVLDVRTPLARAEGTAVIPPDGLPTVELADDGAPTITVPGGEPPAELVVQPLIEGEGPVVESGQTITVHYTGALYSDGSVFDSSWERGSPASFPIGTGGVIAGWDKGLVGQKVGSQVLLVVSAADGYGEEGSGENIPPGATLVFVVDILDAA
jgi:peptidylprolyl isomerase